MRSESIAAFNSPLADGGVCVADGYGIKVFVNRGHLVVTDGVGRHRREQRFARATAKIKRLVLIGHEGYVTLEATRWLADLSIPFIQLDRSGRLIVSSAAVGSDDPRLRRAQAMAAGQALGTEIARILLREKVQGQADVLEQLGANEARSTVEGELRRLENADTLSVVLQAEAEAAAAYWEAWEEIPLRFPQSASERIPEHWYAFGRRGSPITNSPRLAANPANAILNYLYALLEAETRLACLAVGLDPGLGVFHADQRNRDSMALDLMEAVRPRVDAYVLDLLRHRTFTMRSFTETRQGVCRILPPLTHSLCETLPGWGSRVAPIVEGVAKTVAGRAESPTDRLATPLTQGNRSRGRDGIRRRRPRRSSESRPKPLPPACRSCGVILPEEGRKVCDECLPSHRGRAFGAASQAASQRLADLRAEGRDPAHGGSAAQKRSESISKRRAEAKEWEREHDQRPAKELFIREILPRLQAVPIRAMAQATGLTRGYCSAVRRGIHVPHPRHWSALGALAGLAFDTRSNLRSRSGSLC